MFATIVAAAALLLAVSACSNGNEGASPASAGRDDATAGGGSGYAQGGASAGTTNTAGGGAPGAGASSVQAGTSAGGAAAGRTGAGAAGSTAAAGGTSAGSTNGGAGDDTLVEPANLVLTAREGGTGVLELLALTVRRGANGVEVYVSSKNVGAIPACEASISVELFDAGQGSLAAGVTGLLTQHLFRLTDGSGTRASCVATGDVTMAALTSFPPSVALADIAYIRYSYSYFALDVVPIDGLTVSDVRGSALDGGTTYSGTFGNGMDVAVSNPAVTVFALNGVGRPLGLTTANGTDVVAPGGSWVFTTGTVDATGPGYAAYPTATPND